MAPVCQLHGSVGSEKGQWPLPTFLSGRKLSPISHLDARHFSSSLCATGAFQAAILVLELRGSDLIKFMCGFFKRNSRTQVGTPEVSSNDSLPHGFAAKSYGDLSSWHWYAGLGGLVRGWDSLLPRYPPKFLSTTCV